MQFFDELCPVSSRMQRYICVILPVTDSSSNEKFVDILRKFVQQEGNRMTQDRIRITYIYSNVQEKFMNEFGQNYDHAKVLYLESFISLGRTKCASDVEERICDGQIHMAAQHPI